MSPAGWVVLAVALVSVVLAVVLGKPKIAWKPEGLAGWLPLAGVLALGVAGAAAPGASVPCWAGALGLLAGWKLGQLEFPKPAWMLAYGVGGYAVLALALGLFLPGTVGLPAMAGGIALSALVGLWRGRDWSVGAVGVLALALSGAGVLSTSISTAPLGVAGWYGAALALAALVAGLIGGSVGTGVALVVAAGGVWAGVARGLPAPESSWAFAVGALVACIAAWATPGEGRKPFHTVLAAGLGLTAATLVFGFGQGLGIALAGVGAVFAGAVLGRRDLIGAFSPVLALGAYRALRFMAPDASRAFDIGQHYALIGLLVGLLAVLAWTEWAAQADRTNHLTAGALAGLGTLVGVAAALALLGPKGAVGVLLGLGIAPMVASFSRTAIGPSTAFAALSGLAMASYVGLVALAELDRTPKMLAMGGALLAVVLLWVAAWAVARPKPQAVGGK